MDVLVSPEARREIEDARAFYELQLPGLGEEFEQALSAAISRLRVWPLAFPVEREPIRRLVMSRFPFKLLYSVESDHIYLIALAHQHRKPGFWEKR